MREDKAPFSKLNGRVAKMTKVPTEVMELFTALPMSTKAERGMPMKKE